MEAAFAGTMQRRGQPTGSLRAVEIAALVLVALLGLTPNSEVAAAPEPLAPRIADHRIEARFDPDARTVTGHQKLRWRNDSEHPASELRFHLYLNAFADSRTTLMRAMPARVERWAARAPEEWGGIEVTRLHIGDDGRNSRAGVRSAGRRESE